MLDKHSICLSVGVPVVRHFSAEKKIYFVDLEKICTFAIHFMG